MGGKQAFPFRSASLPAKLAGLLVGAGIVAVILSYLLLGQILAPVFGQIEQRVVADQVARAEFALENYVSEIEEKNLDYSTWDDSYDFANRRNPDFLAEMAGPLALTNLDVDLISIIKFDGTVLFNSALDRSQQVIDPEVSERLKYALLEPHLLLELVAKPRKSLLLEADGSVYAIHTSHMVRSDGSGDPAAIHIMGSRLREADLSSALQVDAQLNVEPDEVIRAAFANPNRSSRSTITSEGISTILPLRDYHGELVGTITFVTPRNISFAGYQAVIVATAAMAISLLIAAAMIWSGMQRIVVRRLTLLGHHVAAFNANRQPVSEELTKAGDEVGALARQFDTLGTELEEAEEELRQQSYVQGKADSAIGMLHNIRNALGPLQVKHEKWLREYSQPYRAQLRQAFDELSDAPAGERRSKLEQFARQATGRLLENGDERARELAETKESIDQIVGILADYDFDSSAEVTVEAVDVARLIAREVEAQNQKLPVPIELEIAPDMPPVLVNRIICGQIVGNLITNAIEAMADARADPMRLWVTAASADGERLEIAVRDNGSGAEAGVLERAFERGFSTRKNKSGGAGLHWSANAANALGGRLALSSAGPGHGATALLTLPLAEPDTIRAAA